MAADTTLCPRYTAAVDLLGKRWTGLVLRLLMNGPQRFCALSEALGCSERVLSERLKELQAQGILTREVSTSAPVRVEYRLTKKGQGLSKVVDAIGTWAEKWVEPAP